MSRRPLFIATGIVLALHVATWLASSVGSTFCWGLSPWAHLPGGTLWLLLLIPAFFVLVARVIGPRLGSVRAPTSKPELVDFALLAVIVVLHRLLAPLLSVHGHLLGDGHLIQTAFMRGTIHSDTAPLLNQILLALVGWKLDPTHTVETAFSAVTIDLGVPFLILSFLIWRTLTENREARWLGFALFVWQPTLLFYFGYIEFYPAVWVWALLLVLLALLALQGRISPGWAAAAAVVAPGLHLAFLVFWPAVGYAIYRSAKRDPKKVRRRWIEIVLAVTVVATALFLFADGAAIPSQEGFGPRSVLALGQGHDPYGFGRPLHFWETSQEILLVMPWLLLLPVIAGTRRRRWDAVDRFLGCGALLGLVAFLFVNPDIGYARDWDLMAFPAIFVNLFVARWMLSPDEADQTSGVAKMPATAMFWDCCSVWRSRRRAVGFWPITTSTPLWPGRARSRTSVA